MQKYFREPTNFTKHNCHHIMHPRGVNRGRGQGGQSPPEFGRSVNPIQTRGADYAPYTTASPPDSKSYLHFCIPTMKQCEDSRKYQIKIVRCSKTRIIKVTRVHSFQKKISKLEKIYAPISDLSKRRFFRKTTGPKDLSSRIIDLDPQHSLCVPF